MGNQSSMAQTLGLQADGLDMNTIILALVVAAVLYWARDDIMSLAGGTKKITSVPTAIATKPSVDEEANADDFVSKMQAGVSGTAETCP